jgi:quinol monooxygenase YgiN
MKVRGLLSILLLLLVMTARPSSAQLQQDAAVYVVSYIDVAPKGTATSAHLLRELAAASRKDKGNQRFEILERLAPENQFVIAAIWNDANAYEAHGGTAHTKDFHQQIKPNLISAIDDRLHSGMAVAGTAIANAPEALYVVTHVDVPPPKKDDCISALNALVVESRKEGALRFEVFQQISRPNHFSVAEVWRDQNAYEHHITAVHTKVFRDQLTPMSGALYDERLYRALQASSE